MVNRDELKIKFGTGRVPTENDFARLIDGLGAIKDESTGKDISWSSYKINQYIQDLKQKDAEVTAQLAKTQEQFNQAVGAVTEDSEVVNARTSTDGTQHTTLNQRLESMEDTDEEQYERLETLDKKNVETDTRLDKMETKDNQLEVAVAKSSKTLSEVENTISNVNVNQEATQTVSTDANIASLPVNAGNGALDATLKGFTATQLIENGDFSDGTSLWSGVSATTEISDSQLVVTPDRINQTFRCSYQITFSPSSKYWVKAKIMLSHTDGAEADSLFARTATSGSIRGDFARPPVNDVWHDQSAILTIPAEPMIGNLQIVATYNSGADAVGASMKIDNIQLINLTQTFGAGNEPTKEQCDIIFDTYFDGTKSFTPGRVKSVGKNLLTSKVQVGTTYGSNQIRDFHINSYNYDISTGTLTVNTANMYTGVGLIGKTKPNTQYTVSCTRVSNVNRTAYMFLDKEGALIGRSATAGNPVTFVTPANSEYTVYAPIGQSEGTFIAKDLQLEEGTTATPYEPYTETVQYVEPVKLNRLPNGVADEITADGDFVQRVKEYTLQTNDITRFSTSDDVRLAQTPSYILQDATPLMSYATRDTYIPNWTKERMDSTWGNASSVGKYTTHPTNKRLWFAFPITNTEAEIRTALAGTKIYFQLATPIVHKNVTTGNLISHPKGTVYFEPFQADAGRYSQGVEISNPDLVIKSLESLSVVDFMTGAERELDISDAILTENGFTHPELVEGDIVFFTYEFDAPAPNGNKSLKFYDSRYTIKDDATGQFYKWSIKIANGVPQITVEGV